MPPICPHDLSHAHATLVLEGGTPIEAASERPGYSKTSHRHGSYAYGLPAMQEMAVEAIDGALATAAE